MGGGWFDPFMSPSSASSSMYDCYGMGYQYVLLGVRDVLALLDLRLRRLQLRLRRLLPGYGGGWIVVDPNPGTPVTPSVEGRVVNGRGYTQVRPREPNRHRAQRQRRQRRGL